MNSNNILVRSTEEIDQIVIPPPLKWLIYQECHENIAHLGAKRFCHLAKSRVYWPNMDKDIIFFIDNECPSSLKKTTHHSTCSIRHCNFNIANGHHSYWLRLPQSRHGSWWMWINLRYNRSIHEICTGIGYYKQIRKNCCWNFFDTFVLKFGTLNRILHDRGKELKNILFDELEKYFGIQKCRTTPWHSMCNGMVRRLNSTVIQMLRTYQKNWNIHLKIHSIITVCLYYTSYYLEEIPSCQLAL